MGNKRRDTYSIGTPRDMLRWCSFQYSSMILVGHERRTSPTLIPSLDAAGMKTTLGGRATNVKCSTSAHQRRRTSSNEKENLERREDMQTRRCSQNHSTVLLLHVVRDIDECLAGGNAMGAQQCSPVKPPLLPRVGRLVATDHQQPRLCIMKFRWSEPELSARFTEQAHAATEAQ